MITSSRFLLGPVSLPPPHLLLPRRAYRRTPLTPTTAMTPRCFLREWRVAQDRYSEATQENSQLEIHLGASQAILLASKEEASAARAWLAESDAMVASKMNSKKTSILTPSAFVLTTSLLL